MPPTYNSSQNPRGQETCMETEKAAIKLTMSREARFRDEKQRILESMGGSRVELLTPSANVGLKRKLSTDSGATTSMRSVASPGFVQVRIADEESSVQSDDLSIPIDQPQDQRDPTNESASNRKKILGFIMVAVPTIIIGGIIGVVVALLVIGRDSSADATGDDGVIVSQTWCSLDREELVKCENDVVAVPDCAMETYLELTERYSFLLGDETHCDAAHQGLAALAISQTNYGEDVVDPITFFAMSTLYFALKGNHWRVDRNWLKGSSPCSSFWYGVDCSPDGSISISLEQNRLQGSLPTELGLLSSLEAVRLRVNDVSGSLPTEIGLLSKLQIIDIQDTLIHSELPSEIGKLKELRDLHLAGVPLTGYIPSEVGSLTKLETLFLFGNQFTGTFPTELGNLSSLKNLVLLYLHGVTGTIPLEWISMTNLVSFRLSAYSLDPSPFPEVLTEATDLRWLDIDGSSITGSLPSIANLRKLEIVSIFSNDLTGTIPTDIGLLTHLTHFDVGRLRLDGTIPSEMGRLTKLTSLRVQHNFLSGSVPNELGSLPNLQDLDLSGNNLETPYPTEVCALRSLQVSRPTECT